jgi:hypothetical protein
MDLKRTGRENRRCRRGGLLVATLILAKPGHYLPGCICRPACGPARCSIVIYWSFCYVHTKYRVQSQAAR